MNSRLIVGGVLLVMTGLYGLATNKSSGHLYRDFFGAAASDRSGFKERKSGTFTFPLITGFISIFLGLVLLVCGLFGVGA